MHTLEGVTTKSSESVVRQPERPKFGQSSKSATFNHSDSIGAEIHELQTGLSPKSITANNICEQFRFIRAKYSTLTAIAVFSVYWVSAIMRFLNCRRLHFTHGCRLRVKYIKNRPWSLWDFLRAKISARLLLSVIECLNKLKVKIGHTYSVVRQRDGL